MLTILKLFRGEPRTIPAPQVQPWMHSPSPNVLVEEGPIVVPQKVQPSEDITDEYRSLQRKLGIGLTVPTYHTESVITYLDRKFPKKNWVWVPLRQKDIVRGFSFNDISSRTYSKPIPLAVLKTISEIQEEYPEAKFFISDEKQPGDEKDPFLMVTLDEGRTLHIVERWDEPSFR